MQDLWVRLQFQSICHGYGRIDEERHQSKRHHAGVGSQNAGKAAREPVSRRCRAVRHYGAGCCQHGRKREAKDGHPNCSGQHIEGPDNAGRRSCRCGETLMWL